MRKLVATYKTTRCHNSEGHCPDFHRLKSLKSHTIFNRITQNISRVYSLRNFIMNYNSVLECRSQIADNNIYPSKAQWLLYVTTALTY
jgi:hypothetical protein